MTKNTKKSMKEGRGKYKGQKTCYSILYTSKLLQVPHTNLQFGLHSFRVSAPTLWNLLPHSVRFCESLTTLGNTEKHFISNQHSPATPSNPLQLRSSAPSVWNNLSSELKNSDISRQGFKSCLKSWLFERACS